MKLLGTFFNYKGFTFAINHSFREKGGNPYLVLEDCPQYAHFQSLMEAAREDLKNQPDGRYQFFEIDRENRLTTWNHRPLTFEYEYLETAINLHNKQQ